jgi:hypothetical protein
VVAFIIATYLERPLAAGPERLIAGVDLMNEFGLDPGPLIGELLAVVQEAHDAGEVSSRDEALTLAGSHRRRQEIRSCQERCVFLVAAAGPHCRLCGDDGSD